MPIRRILCCSGGGVRGFATIQFLKRLEQCIKKPLPAVFNMFAGTSTGAVLILGMGVKKFSAAKMSEIYSYKNANIIMDKSMWDKTLPIQLKPKYDGVGKKKFLEGCFGKTTLCQTDKYILVPTYDVEKRRIRVFKNIYCKENERNNAKISEIADASSAAPTYFPTVKIHDSWLIDGGVVANDPTMCAMADAIKIWKDDYIKGNIKILSVGTGYNTRIIDGKHSQGYGAIGWVRHGLINIMMNQTDVEYQARALFGDNYLHVNSLLYDVDDNLDNCTKENVDKLIELGNKWFDDYGKKAIELLQL